ncbi:MAG: MCP four helix bundle domain-containing protein [Asticcacaulis sp.]|uniref:HAMP domain-containing protein n=1 Tax=Asticcacaulis sp. TaxID=1872648 RepID=UPI0039E656A4
MSIRTRVLILVGCFALMALTVTGLGLKTIGDYNRMMKDYDHAYDRTWRGERFNHLISNVVMETRGIYIADDDTQRTGFVKNLRDDLTEMEGFVHQWQADARPAEKPQIDALATQAARFIALRRQVADLATRGDLVAAEAMSTGNRPDRIAFQGEVETLVQQTRTELAAAKTEADRFNHQRAGDFLLTALLGIALIMGLSLWIVAHFITNPLRNLASAIIKTSKGEYDQVIEATQGEDEVSSVWRALAVLKERSMEAERLAAAKAAEEQEKERKLREILLD